MFDPLASIIFHIKNVWEDWVNPTILSFSVRPISESKLSPKNGRTGSPTSILLKWQLHGGSVWGFFLDRMPMDWAIRVGLDSHYGFSNLIGGSNLAAEMVEKVAFLHSRAVGLLRLHFGSLSSAAARLTPTGGPTRPVSEETPVLTRKSLT